MEEFLKSSADAFLILANVDKKSNDINQESTTKKLTSNYLSKFVEGFSHSSININPYGKPYLMNSNIKFNVSHSANKYSILLSDGIEVGIDIEKMSDKKRVLKIAQRFFNIKEFEFLESLKEEFLIESFYKMWTIKESLVKCIGFQMFNNMDKIDTLNKVWEIDSNTPFSKVRELYCMYFEMDKLYQASLCFEKPIRTLSVFYP